MWGKKLICWFRYTSCLCGLTIDIVSEEILKTEDAVEEIDDIDVIDGNPKKLETEDSLDDYDGGKFSYSQDSLRKHKRKLSKERTKPRRKVSNVVEVDEKLLAEDLEKK